MNDRLVLLTGISKASSFEDDEFVLSRDKGKHSYVVFNISLLKNRLSEGF